MDRRAGKFPALCFVICLVLIGCSYRPDGWGVFLWSHDEQAFPTGSTVPIVETSMLNTTYDIQLDKRAQVFTVDQWRLAFFKRKSRAEEYSARFNGYRDLYAVSNLAGLPVRDDRDPISNPDAGLPAGQLAGLAVIEGKPVIAAAGAFDDDLRVAALHELEQ